MARSRSSAKKAGTQFETELSKKLTEELGMPVARMPKSGSLDKGDIHGVFHKGLPVAIECKNPGKKSPLTVSEWWKETEAESNNIGSGKGILVIRRYGKKAEKSLCVMDDKMFFKFTDEISDDLDIREIGCVAFSKWSDLLSEGLVIKTPRKGKEGFWMVSELSLLITFLDSINSQPAIYLSHEDIELIKSGNKILSTATNGEKVSIALDSDFD